MFYIYYVCVRLYACLKQNSTPVVTNVIQKKKKSKTVFFYILWILNMSKLKCQLDAKLRNSRHLQLWDTQHELSAHCRKGCAERSKRQLSLQLYWNEFWVWQEGAAEDMQLYTEKFDFQRSFNKGLCLVWNNIWSGFLNFITTHYVNDRADYEIFWATPEKMPFMIKVRHENKCLLTFTAKKYTVFLQMCEVEAHSSMPQTWFQLARLSKPLHSITPLLAPTPPIPPH